MLKSPIRRIGGYGLFQRYENMPVSRAWHEFGYGNGVGTTAEALRSRITPVKSLSIADYLYQRAVESVSSNACSEIGIKLR